MTREAPRTNADEWAQYARERFDAGSFAETLAALESAFLNDASHVGALTLAAELERAIGNVELAESFQYLAENPEDVDELYELGYLFIDMEVHTLAVAFLSRANEIDPEHREVTYELAWALMKIGGFTHAIPLLERSQETDPDYRTLDCLATAHALSGDAKQAQDSLDAARIMCEAQLGDEDDGERVILDDTEALIARLRFASPSPGAGLREWHWIQTGGALLHLVDPEPDYGATGGRGHHCVMTPAFLARLVRLLEALLRTAGFTPDVIEYLDGEAELPARVIALRLGAALRGPTDDRAEDSADIAARVLSIASSTDAIAPLAEVFDVFTPGEILFSLTHDWTRGHPICPDIIGVMTGTHKTPWSTTAVRQEGVTVQASNPYRKQLEQYLEIADEEETTIADFYEERPLALSRDVPGRRPEFRVESPVASPLSADTLDPESPDDGSPEDGTPDHNSFDSGSGGAGEERDR